MRECVPGIDKENADLCIAMSRGCGGTNGADELEWQSLAVDAPAIQYTVVIMYTHPVNMYIFLQNILKVYPLTIIIKMTSKYKPFSQPHQAG